MSENSLLPKFSFVVLNGSMMSVSPEAMSELTLKRGQTIGTKTAEQIIQYHLAEVKTEQRLKSYGRNDG